VSNTPDSAISIDQEASQGSQPDAIVETVAIKDVGSFTQKQVETFKRVQNLKNAVELGMDLHTWLCEEGLPSLPAEYHVLVSEVADAVLATYPYEQLDGLPALADFTHTLLYRPTPPTWLTDAATHACCVRLVHDFTNCRFAGFQSLVARSKRTRTSSANPIDVKTWDRIFQLVAKPGVDTVFLPLNFMNAHWCCVVVKVKAKRIYYYDPLNQAPYMNAAAGVCAHLRTSGLNEYDVV
jgi:hypothetical protein